MEGALEPDGREGDRRCDLGPNPGEGRGAPLFVAVDQQHAPAPMSERGRIPTARRVLPTPPLVLPTVRIMGGRLSGFRGDGVCTSPP